MKYSTYSNDSSLFCEQVQSMTTMYEQWNDCEKTVVCYSLFKRLPFANLKFLIHSIDHYLKQSFNTPHRLSYFEDAANAITFLNKLISKYNSLITITTSNDKIDATIEEFSSGEAKNLEDELVSKYASKEEIVNDLLIYLPLLRPNNEEGKKIYMQFLPVLIDDTMKHNLPIELVQQILSYLLIHPAMKVDDRKALNQSLRQLEDHFSAIQSYSSTATLSQIPTETASSFLSTTSSISSASSSSSSASSNTWPTTMQQQMPAMGSMFQTKRDQELWDLRNATVPQDFCDDIMNQTKFPTPIGNNKKPSQILNSTKHSCVSSSGSIFDVTPDEHHISFAKNGKEIVDFSSEILDGSKQSSTNLLMGTSSASTDYLTVPSLFSDNLFDIYGGFGSDAFSDDGNAVKTRRSNSLTNPTATSDFVTSSSAENLASFQKPRSFSLSTESSRNQLVSSGSDTRLDDYSKMNHLFNCSNHVGMGHIGVWLKSLRLHKYFWLFTNMSYKQMMEITEEYLENLGVTKGARHKLVLCIQKLGERVVTLRQIEKELMEGSRAIKSGLEELTNIVLTPMKPINSVPNDEDVASCVMKVLDVAFQSIMSIKYLTNADEESVSMFIWVIDKALHHDAFVTQTGHLKELKYKMQRIRSNFVHKGHFMTSNKGNNKMRWGGKQMKPNTSQGMQESQSKIHRKGSMQYHSVQPYNAQAQASGGGKSSSFPSFNNQTSNNSNFQRSVSREKLNQFSLMQQQHHHQFNQPINPQSSSHQNTNQAPAYHRHSLNTLMPFNPTQGQFMNRRNSSCGTDRVMNSHSMLSPLSNQEKHLSDSGLSSAMNSSSSAAAAAVPTTSDINSRLESLCRQMTEQAIN